MTDEYRGMYNTKFIIALLLFWVLVLNVGLCFAVDTITTDLGGTPSVVSINANNKALLNRLLVRENARRAAQTPPLLAQTLEQFVADLIVDMLKGYKAQAVGRDHEDACATFRALTANQQATVIARPEWGGFSPCPQ